MLVGQRPVGPRRLIVSLAVLAALLVLVAAWRWILQQNWLSPQRVAEFMTRFSSPEGRALAVAGVGLASVLVSPHGLSLSVPRIPAFAVSWDGPPHYILATKGKMRFAGRTWPRGQGRPQANRRFWFYQLKDWRAAGLSRPPTLVKFTKKTLQN